ncbi:MAG: hypothetical protein ACI9VS_003341, partial [Candidatus Binatia bacterium]
GTIKIGTGVEAEGTNSSINITSSTGLSVTSGGVIAVRSSGSSITLGAGTFLHVDSGAAVTAGARFEDVAGVPTAVKTGDNTSITMSSDGELLLGGAITSAGALDFTSGNSIFEHADYFDYILSKKLASMAADGTLIAALNNGTLPASLRMLFTDNNVPLGANITITAVANQTTFAELTEAQRATVAGALGYVVQNGPSYYNKDAAAGDRLVTTFTQGPLPVADAAGYTAFSGPVYYNPQAAPGKVIVTTFAQGGKTDYQNSEVNWGTVSAPSANATFDSLSSAQKMKVAEHLGYEYDSVGKVYFNYLADEDNRIRDEFVQGPVSDYSNANIFWGAAGAPSENAGFSSLTADQKQRVVESLRYTTIEGATVYYNADAVPSQRVLTSLTSNPNADYSNESIDWGGVLAPADDDAFDTLSFEQRSVVALFLGYVEFEGSVYYNPGAAAADQWLQTITEGSTGQYKNTDIDWGEIDPPADTAGFDDLNLNQKRTVAQSLGYIEFQGIVYHNPDAAIDKRFQLDFTQGATGDYKNTDIFWSVVEVPQPATAFDVLTDGQKRHVAGQLGYIVFDSEVYFDEDHATKPLVTNFVQGVDYTNAAVGLIAELVNNRWAITDGSDEYLLYAADPEGDGIFNEIHIREQHQLFGQRGFGFLLTGTVTTLQDGKSITVEVSDPAINRGAFKLFGADSDLTFQSDSWIYWEGVADITGDLKIYGGVKLDGTNTNGANSRGDSVYVHETASLVTAGAGTDITVRGGQDVYLGGVTVAGGDITAMGIEWAGPDSTVTISAGQQLYIGTTVVATKSVTVSSGAPGADDNGLSFLLATDGGLVTPGITSNNRGGTVSVMSGGDIQLQGGILSGGRSDNDVITWGAEPSTIRIETTGQAWVGGDTVDINNVPVEVGGKLYASQKIEIIGGSHPSDGVGVKLPGSSYVVVNNPNGEIHIKSDQDAVVSAVLAAGGEIITHKDPDNLTLGVTVNSFNGDSIIKIEAGHQVVIGRNLTAGKQIDVLGGQDPIDGTSGSIWEGQGLVVFGSAHIITTQPDSEINLGGSGDVSLLAPAWADEVIADGFAQYADGHITENVGLVVEVDLGTHKITGTVYLAAADTVGNTGLAGLVSDLQAAFDATVFTVTESVSGMPAMGSTQTTDEITVRLSDGRLLLTSAFPFELKSTSTNPGTIGFTQLTSGNEASYKNYAVDASGEGSKVNIVSLGGGSGTISIQAWIRGHSGINFVANGANVSLQNLDFGVTGRLETLSGGLVFNLGNDAVLFGSLVARGPGADVILTANRSLDLRGDVTAQDDIIISAGSDLVPGLRSIYTHGTSSLTTLDDGGVIRITGVNDVVINSVIGEDQPNLKLMEITSTDGTLSVEKEAGQLLTGAQLNLSGRVLNIDGVVTSSRATASTTDNEVVLRAVDNISLTGTLSLQGSMRVTSDADINLSNIRLLITNPGQHLIVDAAGDVRLGNTIPVAGFSDPTATVLQADDYVQFIVGGNLLIGYDAQVYASGDDSEIRIEAKGLAVVGLVYAGASFDQASVFTWTGKKGSVFANIDEAVILGGQGLDTGFNIVNSAGTIASSGSVSIIAGIDQNGLGLALSSNDSIVSSIIVDATGDGKWTPATAGQIMIEVDGDVQIFGFIDARDAGADVSIASDGLVFVDGLVTANDMLTVTGGRDSTGAGIVVTGVVLDVDLNRVSGGVLDVAPGGTIELRAIQNIQISGVV